MGKLLIGRREILSSGLVALQTYLGWILMGKVPQDNASKENLDLSVTSMFVKESEIVDLGKLDSIGINDLIEKQSKIEFEHQVKEHFLQTVKMNEDNCYEVSLPWS